MFEEFRNSDQLKVFPHLIEKERENSENDLHENNMVKKWSITHCFTIFNIRNAFISWVMSRVESTVISGAEELIPCCCLRRLLKDAIF